MTAWDSRHGKTVTRPRRRSGGATRAPARLCVVYPRELVAALPLEGARVVLGRNPEPDGPRVRHSTVSRRHAALAWDAGAGGYALVDLDSHNGTSLNGARVEAPVALRSGDVVRLGDVLCVYECGDGLEVDDAPEVSHDQLPGSSAAVRVLRAQVARAAADPAPVLIVGATGTGKERVAAELHRRSGRKGELVIVNCAAVSALLFESQLFGHERGAFTGATSAQPGMFRAANKGTLFLDELGETPLELQAKLLRAVQEREIVPVGSSRVEHVDVRVIAATNRALEAEVERGTFRRDLYARLARLQVRVPSLVERRADLLAWFDRLRRDWVAHRPLRSQRRRGALELEVEAAQALLLAAWPENLRGLDRLVHELAAHDHDPPIAAAMLPAWLAPGAVAQAAEAAPAARPPVPTRDELLAFLEGNQFNVRAAAQHFQRDRRQIYRWMEQHGIAKPD